MTALGAAGLGSFSPGLRQRPHVPHRPSAGHCPPGLSITVPLDSECDRRSQLPAATRGPLLSEALTLTRLGFALLRAGLPTQGPRRCDDRASHPVNGAAAPCQPRAPRRPREAAGLRGRERQEAPAAGSEETGASIFSRPVWVLIDPVTQEPGDSRDEAVVHSVTSGCWLACLLARE